MDDSRITVTIPASAGPAVNAALEAAVGPEAAATFHVHPPHPTDPDALDTTLLIASWDLAATGHDKFRSVIEQAITTTAKTGKTTTAKIAVGPADEALIELGVAKAEVSKVEVSKDEVPLEEFTVEPTPKG
jgi:hypothetical protein